jgi:hypothetical protein
MFALFKKYKKSARKFFEGFPTLGLTSSGSKGFSQL